MSTRRVCLLGLLLTLPFLVSCSTPILSGNLPVRQLFTEGLAYEALSNYSAALDRYKSVLENYGGDGSWSQRARLRMARIHNNHLNQPDRAIAYYNNFLEYHGEPDETKASVLMELARVYREQGMTDRAIETYRRVIENFSSISQVEESYYNLGEIYLDQQNYQQTISTFKKLLEEFPQGDLQDGALFQLAKAYEGSEQYEKQLETYLTLLEDHPESDLYQYTVFLTVKLAARLDRRETALKWARQYREKYPEGQYLERIYAIVKSEWNVDLQSQ